MTGLGLVLLAIALVLNHRHPHNQGVATLPHNNIYQMELKAIGQAQAALAAVTAKPISQAVVRNAYSPAPVATTAAAPVAAPVITATPDLCASIDEQSFSQASQSYDAAYQTYQASMDPSSDSDKNKKPYQDYLDSLNQAYQSYQKDVAAAGCTPSQQAPAPQPM